MITPTIKRWLSNLFAWWPWKRTATTVNGSPSRNGAMVMPQEYPWSDEGSLPQTGVQVVVVEQSIDNATPEPTVPLRPPSVEHVDIVAPSSTLRDVSFPPRLSQDEKILEDPVAPNAQVGSEITPTPEQQLAFLAYLVSRGLVNEGFEEGEVPEQYSRKK